jgi:hypothetical protein
MVQFRKLALLVVACAVLVPAAPASAKIQIGISEQNWKVFTNPYFKKLQLKYARLVVPWNVGLRKDYTRDIADAWLAGAKADNIEPHIAFGVAGFSDKYFGKGPTLAQYTKAVKAFRKRWPDVKVFSPWNEENHVFQVTARSPKLAAQYYSIMKKQCRGCKILAADVLDDANLTSWLKRFKRYVKGKPRLWGLHNYQDANKHRPFKQSWTYKLSKLVKGDIWSTEAGGLVGFKTVKGRIAYKYSLSRQLKAQRYLFKLMGNRKVRNRYKRVYIYNFFGTWTAKRRTSRWDSGLVGLNGKPRPAYYDLKKHIARNR